MCPRGLLPAPALSLWMHQLGDLGCVARLDHTGNAFEVLCFPLIIQQCSVGTTSKFNSNLCFAGWWFLGLLHACSAGWLEPSLRLLLPQTGA